MASLVKERAQMDVRFVGEDDLPSLSRLMAELGYPTSIDEMTKRMEIIRSRSDHAAFVAEENGAIAGMIGLSTSPSFYRDGLSGAIVALVVAPEFRGRGIAELLVGRGEQWLRAAGVDRATVNPSTHRTPAHHLYTRLGYAPTGTRFTKTL